MNTYTAGIITIYNRSHQRLSYVANKNKGTKHKPIRAKCNVKLPIK